MQSADSFPTSAAKDPNWNGALNNLEKACQGRAFLAAFVKADPIFDSLRAEPRYQAILKKMGLDKL